MFRDNGGPASCLWHNKGTSLLLVLFILVFSFLSFFFSCAACVTEYLKGCMDQMCVGLTIETFQPSAFPAPVGFYRLEGGGKITTVES